MTRTRGSPRGEERNGFTLLEMMAVVTILGLTALLVLPNLGVTEAAVLRNEAREVASAIEYARQRAEMTGYPHRLLVGVDEGLYRIEWFVSDEEAAADEAGDEEVAPPVQVASGAPISLSPPRAGIRDYRPIPGVIGRDSWLSEGLSFKGVDTPEGWIDSGDVAVVFDRDGTTDAARIEIGNRSGHALVLEVRPLLDVVRISEAEDSG